jgi:NADH-quinone oxidoreductase subunit M
MNLFAVPWLELTVLVPIVGAVGAACCRDGGVRRQWGSAATAAALLCALLTWLGHESGGSAAWEAIPSLLGFRLFALDGLSAPLLPLVALIAFLIAHSATGPDGSRWNVALLLVAEAAQLAAFGTTDAWAVAAFLALGTLPPYLDLRLRRAPSRGFAAHAGLFVALLATGAALRAGGATPAVACVPFLLAALARTGIVPLHLWATDLFEKGSFAAALLYATPLAGVYIAVRFVLPVCPEWVLRSLGFVSLFTAVYTAGLSVVQTDARRFTAYQFASHAALVMVGLQLNTPISLTGALCLWFTVALSLAGQGLALRAVEERFGRIGLTGFRGLYDNSPPLAMFFLVAGLGSVGFPGTLGFVAAEMLAGGAVGADPAVGVTMIAAAALNGIAVLRVYFLIFTGGGHATGVPLAITRRERVVALLSAALILGGGLYPQPGVESRHRAAAAVLADRHENLGATGRASPSE